MSEEIALRIADSLDAIAASAAVIAGILVLVAGGVWAQSLYGRSK